MITEEQVESLNELIQTSYEKYYKSLAYLRTSGYRMEVYEHALDNSDFINKNFSKEYQDSYAYWNAMRRDLHSVKQPFIFPYLQDQDDLYVRLFNILKDHYEQLQNNISTDISICTRLLGRLELAKKEERLLGKSKDECLEYLAKNVSVNMVRDYITSLIGESK